MSILFVFVFTIFNCIKLFITVWQGWALINRMLVVDVLQ